METIKLQAHVGQDGALQVTVPEGLRNQDLEILMVFQPVVVQVSEPLPSAPKVLEGPEALGYSRYFLEEVVGGWLGEPLERPQQLEFEEREEWT
ncbi:hypothetical protein VB712_18135 [Spirulina sp. CCNP1310]|uniref:hypothetical protein n=1 Tax=Spirulina sp. CCNP1310 TaxID=3110249 RepID=UPI002B1F835F|nr:hypothetical protein [Spirulina sp. CCNP1310]MEA5421149.1 hypothetical protein [Spirulina sp. CCNP1310]